MTVFLNQGHLQLIPTGPQVWHSTSWDIRVDSDTIDWLRSQALQSNAGRARICFHPTLDDPLQHMLVCLTYGAVDAIHHHPNKNESIVPIDGSADLESFREDGSLLSTINLGKDGARCVSSPKGVWHRLVVRSETFTFLEFSSGPFESDSTIRRGAP